MLWFVALTALAWPSLGQELALFADYQSQTAFLDEDGRVKLSWLAIGNHSIHLEILAETTGWVGLGLSPNGGMKGSDMVIGGVDAEGKPYAVDTHGIGNELPIRDKSQLNLKYFCEDWDLLRSAENTTHTRLLYKRSLVTCDEEDFDLSEDTVRVLWAMGEADLAQPDSATFASPPHKVTHRGASVKSRSLILLGNSYEPPPLPKNAYPIDFRHSHVDIPADFHTHYWCQIFRLDQRPTSHMIKVEPVISKETRPYVHHILLYHCMGNMSHLANTSESCFNRDQTEFSEMYSCATRMIGGWAVGGESVTLPDDLGFPMFEDGVSPFYMLEVHYDNKHGHEGLVDHSGLRVWLVDELRPIDVGSFSLGMGVAPKAMLIPPKQKRFVLYSFCDPQCTKNFPDDGINVISIFPHAHYIGVGIVVRHIRNGTELEPLMVDNSYDFNYQDSRKFWPSRKVMQNDTLLLECHFDSSKRDGPTFGGFATNDEMCFAFMAFYPRRNDSMTMCLAGPIEEEFAAGMNSKKEPTQPAFSGRNGAMLYGKYGSNLTLREYANVYDWEDPAGLATGALSRAKRRTSLKGELLQRRLRRGDYYETCGRMAPADDTTSLDKHIAELRNQLETMAWTIHGKKELPIPEFPRREVDTCGRRQVNSEDWEESDPIPDAVAEKIQRMDAMTDTDGHSAKSFSSASPTARASVFILLVMFLSLIIW